jgi:UDP-2,3-diacylglucosamine pyrophosphatase LpxH
LTGAVKRRIGAAARYVMRFEQAAAEEAYRRGVDGVVCGHIHNAALHRRQGIVYCNTGDWVESCTALVEHFDGSLALMHCAGPPHQVSSHPATTFAEETTA